MPTVAFYHMPAHGHINPTLPVQAELVRRGDRVIAYASLDLRDKVTSTGAEFREYPPFGYDHEKPPTNMGATASGLLEFAVRATPGLIAEARAEQISYVMHDSMAPWGRAVATSLKLPAICSTSTFALPSGVPRSPKYIVMKGLIYAQGAAHFPALWGDARKLSSLYGLQFSGFIDIFRNRSDLNLVYTSELFQPLATTLGSTYKFCGPSIPETVATDPSLLEELGQGPLIYASLGTLFNDRPDFFRRVLAALKDFDGRVLLSVGHKIDPASLGPLPANAVVRASVPQVAILQRAALFLTHGGMNSVSEGLYFGVPQLVYPQAGDQMLVADRVAGVGAGIVLKDKDLEPRRLRSLVAKVLADRSFKERADRIGASFRAAGGYREAVAQIERFKRRTGIGADARTEQRR